MIIDGKNFSEEIKLKLKGIVDSNNLSLKLSVIIVGDNDASKIYVRNKIKACEYIGVESEVIKCDSDISEKELLNIVKRLNNDDSVNGILVQLPLPEHIDDKKVILEINPKKDVDGFHPINIGNLMLNIDATIPCTPKGIMTLLNSVHNKFSGVNVVVLGRSNIVGKPIANLLVNKGATVTITNSKTENLKDICKKADILIVAVGKAKFITSEYIKAGATVIDVGINRIGEKKIVGDVDFENVKDICAYITPVPGGVGPMTIAMLLTNLVESKINSKLL